MPFLKTMNNAGEELSELQEKAAFFAKLGSGAEVQDDEWEPREARDRERRRRFFRQRRTQHKTAKPQHEVIDDDLVIVSGPTPKRVKDQDVLKETPLTTAKTSSPSVIEETPINIAIPRRRGRINRLLHSDGVDETLVPDSAKMANKTLQRSNSTPLLKLKRTGSSNLKDDSPLSNNPRNKRQKHSAGSGTSAQQSVAPLTLQGCTFFYIPDNDIAPIRKIRIAKAKEHGAERTRDIGKASHVIVDRALDYKMVQSYLLKADRARPPVIVNDEYPIECIQFGSMVDPCQARYRLEGQPGEEKVDKESVEVASSFESVRSLQLKAGPKNPRRWDYVPPPETPLRSEESAQSSLRKASPLPLDAETAPTLVQKKPLDDELVTSSGKDGDELTELISALHEVRDLPVEVEDDQEAEQKTEGEHVEADAESSEDEGSGREINFSKRKTLTYDERFACNQAGIRKASIGNPNGRTIEILQKMATYYDRINDHWRTTAYRKAISTLKRQTHKITTEKEAALLPSVGSRLAKKIEEIVSTDRLQRLEHVEQEPIDASLQLFTGIYGVGFQQARRWIAQGLRTLDDIREKAKLSTNQRLGLDHYDDLNTRIPRGEMDELARTVKEAAKRIDASVEVIVGGSYRRGADSSGDIDFILTRSDTSTTAELAPFLRNLVSYLESTGFLCARLASSRSDDDGSKWHGCCVLPKQKNEKRLNDDEQAEPKWRRIDMLLVPETERGAALIYFTGNDIFNRSMRLLASRKGMRLNQRGLYGGAMRGPGRQKISEGELIEGKDEKRIFEVLGVRWREPHERWC